MQTERKPASNYRVNEFRLDNKSAIKSTYGTAQQCVRPTVVFVKGKAKFTPKEKEDKDYLKEVGIIETEFKAAVKKVLTRIGRFQERYLLTYNFSDAAICYGKPSLLRYELLLKPIQKETLEKIKPLLEEVIDGIDSEVTAMMEKFKLKIYS